MNPVLRMKYFLIITISPVLQLNYFLRDTKESVDDETNSHCDTKKEFDNEINSNFDTCLVEDDSVRLFDMNSISLNFVNITKHGRKFVLKMNFVI